MNTAGFDLVLSEDTYRRIADICADTVHHAAARVLLLVGPDGAVLVKQGFTGDLDCDSLAALCAATYASTRAIASLIGETQFDTFYHQGRSNHVLMSRVGDDHVLVALFDERTTGGMVRLFVKDAARRVGEVIGESQRI